MADDKYADEALSDDELDGVAGGSFEELKADAQALESVLPPAIRLSYPSGIGNMRIYDRDAVIGVFKRCGVDVNFDFNKPNEYFRGGNKITREEAIEHAKSILDKMVPSN